MSRVGGGTKAELRRQCCAAARLGIGLAFLQAKYDRYATRLVGPEREGPVHFLTVDEHLIETAKSRGIAEREMAVSAEQLFATFEDGPSLTK